MCFMCGADTNLSFIITSEIARVYLNEFKRKYPCKLWTWFMTCKHRSIRFNTRSQLGRKMHARDKMRTGRKTSSSISLLSSKLTILFYSIYKHDTIDIADPSSMQDACHVNFSMDVAHRRVSVAQ